MLMYINNYTVKQIHAVEMTNVLHVTISMMSLCRALRG